MDVNKVDDARSGYYEGKAFLNERIAEEDLVIKNIMDKKDAEKSSGYKELSFVPEGNLAVKNIIDKGVAEKKRFVVSYACEGCGKWITGDKGKDGKVFCKNCGCMIYPTATRKSLAIGTESGKEGDGDKWSPIEVRQIESTSAKAVLVELFGEKGDMWIPKSCVSGGELLDKMATGVKTVLFVKEWFLKKNGLM
jgi:hypothetical protein